MDCHHSVAPTSTVAPQPFLSPNNERRNERVVVCKKMCLVAWWCAVEKDKCWLEFDIVYTVSAMKKKVAAFFFNNL